MSDAMDLYKAQRAAKEAIRSGLDQDFIAALEKRSMSTWSEQETHRYNGLTGQSTEQSDILSLCDTLERYMITHGPRTPEERELAVEAEHQVRTMKEKFGR